MNARWVRLVLALLVVGYVAFQFEVGAFGGLDRNQDLLGGWTSAVNGLRILGFVLLLVLLTADELRSTRKPLAAPARKRLVIILGAVGGAAYALAVYRWAFEDAMKRELGYLLLFSGAILFGGLTVLLHPKWLHPKRADGGQGDLESGRG